MEGKLNAACRNVLSHIPNFVVVFEAKVCARSAASSAFKLHAKSDDDDKMGDQAAANVWAKDFFATHNNEAVSARAGEVGLTSSDTCSAVCMGVEAACKAACGGFLKPVCNVACGAAYGACVAVC